MPKKTIVVLGFHKSGTSATAGVLSRLGVDLGRELRKGDKRNPKGYYEDVEFLQLNDEILKAAGGDAWYPPPYEKILEQGNVYSEKISKLIESKNDRSSMWGWKTTTTCLTIELFLLHLINPCFVVVFRNPLEAASSAVEHTDGKIDFLGALSLANFYNQRLVDFLKQHPDVPTHYISFNDLVANPVEKAKELADFLEIQFTEAHKSEIEKFIIPRSKIKREKTRKKIQDKLGKNPLHWAKGIKDRVLSSFR